MGDMTWYAINCIQRLCSHLALACKAQANELLPAIYEKDNLFSSGFEAPGDKILGEICCSANHGVTHKLAYIRMGEFQI